MKKSLFLLFFAILVVAISGKANQSSLQTDTKNVTQAKFFKHIHFEVIVQGMTVTLDGDVSYSVWTGNYTFSGCATVSGPGVNVSACGLTVHGHIGNRTGYNWGTNNITAEKTLNSDEFLTDFETFIESN